MLGTITAIAWMATPLGVLLGGFLLQALDPRLVLLIVGAAYVATLVSFLFHPALRQMNTRRTSPNSLETA